MGTDTVTARSHGRIRSTTINKRVLVIDDVRTFRFDAAYARDVQAAISLLSDGFDEVWFDHDLANGESVRPVVEWILEQIRLGTPPAMGMVIVHSSSPSGAKWIAAQLGDHYPTRVLDHDTVYRLRQTM